MEANTETLKVVPCINPAAAITGNGVTTGATINAAGFESLTFVAQTGVVTDGTFTGQIFAGNASNMSDEAQLTAADLIGAPSANAVDIAAADDNVCERVGVNLQKVRKQYYRIKVTQAGATSGGFLAAHAILSQPRTAPVASP